MKLTLQIWRQKNAKAEGKIVEYPIDGIEEDMSFLEMLDVLNEKLINKGDEPVSFDHDCREGICGTCSLFINGEAHGPDRGIPTCQLHMRMFKDGDTIFIEPFRAVAFPVIKDLVVDRSAFDRIQHAGGFVSVNTSGNPVDANTIPIPKHDADRAFDAATCIGCGACVATCKNSSAMLFVAAKVSQFALLPQGRVEATDRVLNMVNQMDAEGFGNCTNTGACEEDGAFEAFAHDQIDRACGARREWHGDGLAALAQHGQRSVSALEGKVFDPGANRFGHPEAIERKERNEGMVASTGKARGDEHRTDLVAVQANGVGLVVHFRSTHMNGWGVLNEAFLFGVPVEAGDRPQPSGDRRPRATVGFHLASECFDVRAADVEEPHPGRGDTRRVQTQI